MKEKGLFQKYHVTRTDGKPVDWCFVLELKDEYARIALETYADQCEAEYPDLADDLRQKVFEYEEIAKHEEF